MRYYLYELNHNFSVLSITESWLKQYNRSTYNLKGYTHLSKIREDRTGGGVSLFVKKELRYELKEEILLDLPGVAVYLKLMTTKLKIKKSYVMNLIISLSISAPS